ANLSNCRSRPHPFKLAPSCSSPRALHVAEAFDDAAIGTGRLPCSPRKTGALSITRSCAALGVCRSPPAALRRARSLGGSALPALPEPALAAGVLLPLVRPGRQLSDRVCCRSLRRSGGRGLAWPESRDCATPFHESCFRCCSMCRKSG